MPIIFNSIEDPYGIVGASKTLGNAYIQKSLLEREEKNQLAKEKRGQDLKKEYGAILAEALDPKKSGPEKELALQQYITSTGDTSVLPMLKSFSEERDTQNLLKKFGLLPGDASKSQSTDSPSQNVTQDQIDTPEEPTQSTSLRRLSLDQLKAMAASGNKKLKVLADTELKTRDIENKEFQADRKYHAKGAEKAADYANNLRRSIRGQEGALQQARQAIETGETGPISWANISKRLDIPELMNAAGTELSQAGKEFFFGNMQKLSAKAQNQWLEQRITQLSAQIGDPKINALMKNVMLEGDMKLGQAYLESYDKLVAQDEKEHRFTKKDIEARAFADSEKKSQEIMDEVSFKTRQLYEEEKGTTWLKEHSMDKVPKGTYLTPQMAKLIAHNYGGNYEKGIENAKKLGYRVPTKQEAAKFQ